MRRDERHKPVRARRFHVIVRSKVRTRRMSQWGAVVVVVVLGAAAYGVVRHFPFSQAADRVRGFSRNAWDRMVPSGAPVETVSIEGAPAALRGPLLTVIRSSPVAQWGVLEPYRSVRRLKSGFPCLRDVWFTRNWFRRSVTFEVVLHRPVARVLRDGKSLWLSETGALYTVSEGVYPEGSWPWVEVGASNDRDYVPLAQFVTAASKEGALPFGLARLAYRSSEDGWEARLSDGTTLLWGGLSWTDQKLARLREVFTDAGKRFGSGITVDLRYFEDGKILVHPIAQPVGERRLRQEARAPRARSTSSRPVSSAYNRQAQGLPKI